MASTLTRSNPARASCGRSRPTISIHTRSLFKESWSPSRCRNCNTSATSREVADLIFGLESAAPLTSEHWKPSISPSKSLSWIGADMTAPHRSLVLSIYAPALGDDTGRTLSVVRGLEYALPGLRLGWTISDKGEFIPVPQRDEWLAQAEAKKTLPMLCNGKEDDLVTVSGWERPAGISSGGQPQFEVHAELPLDATRIAASVAVLETMAEGAHAFWGRLMPSSVAAEMAQQVRHSTKELHAPPRGLPALNLTEDIPSPEIPHHLGWLNYWSAATSRALGFPAHDRDVNLLSRSRRTATGGWVLRLTDEPLDLDNPAHLDALLRAYERFPGIGGRFIP
ncbi:hypothetical protein SAMN05444354_11230 [Stigmatella aurantiaca]|uniref:DUF3396 domain-containing protein n=2 Tax=Stigmatella aurantiaca TaxID=41 RepID=A0A1H7VW94_STIAU|nr:hypothetical protein SAMN05444354_11230 [Stigmatella aurantiaca]